MASFLACKIVIYTIAEQLVNSLIPSQAFSQSNSAKIVETFIGHHIVQVGVSENSIVLLRIVQVTGNIKNQKNKFGNVLVHWF